MCELCESCKHCVQNKSHMQGVMMILRNFGKVRHTVYYKEHFASNQNNILYSFIFSAISSMLIATKKIKKLFLKYLLAFFFFYLCLHNNRKEVYLDISYSLFLGVLFSAPLLTTTVV